jgi:diguanylate cyclase (GGDEF)-like protein/PAS domain S-box-containing protein
MYTTNLPSVSVELQRLRRWLGFFGAWNAVCREGTPLDARAEMLCRLLVEKADFVQARLNVRQTDGTVHPWQFPPEPLDAAPKVRQLVLSHNDCSLGELELACGDMEAESSVEEALLNFLGSELAHDCLRLQSGSDSQLQILMRAIQQSPLAIVVMDPYGKVQYCNPSFTEMTGYSLQDVRHDYAHVWNPLHQAATVYEALLSDQSAPGSWSGEHEMQRKDGSRYWERQVVSTLRDDAGSNTHLIVVKVDITAHKTQLDANERLRHLQDQALISSSNGIMISRGDANDHSIVYVNPAFERITGYAAEEVIGRVGRFLLRDDMAQPALEGIRAALREKREGQATLRNYRKDGSLFWNELHIAPVHDLMGESITHFVSVINDVSERVRYQQALEYQATHDSLTGLANRSLLNDRIEQAIAWAKRNNNVVGVMLLDLDHFKRINDASGHTAGDALLKEVAQRLRGCVRETDTVARLGGDEFVVILTDLPQPDDIDHIAQKVLGVLARPIELVGRDVQVTASIGLALYPRDGDHGDVLMRYADMAMYRVKEHGRNSVRQFVPEMGNTAISRLDMEAAMRRALDRGEFLLHYQPKVDLASERMVGVEALVRWQHPQIGLVHPIEFIRLAEETGLILPLGEWVLQEACRQQAQWALDGYGDMRVAVNMSARQFRLDNLTERVRSVIEQTGSNPSKIILEMTESMVMQDADTTRMTLGALKELGLGLSLDDFGTGYSSLSYLRRFPINELKIDRSFINDIHTNEDDAAIARAIVAMAKSLSLSVVAEGVERKQQAELLREMGCHHGQGYLYARPMTAQAVLQRLHLEWGMRT